MYFAMFNKSQLLYIKKKIISPYSAKINKYEFKFQQHPSQTENNLKILNMLSDSKIREAGFIRNSSSRKIIYQPEPQKRNHSSDDSFSSFEYESTEKRWAKEADKGIGNNNTSIVKREQRDHQQKSYQSLTRHTGRQGFPQVPPQIPKPSKKPLQQPTFENQRLKNNFFQQSQQTITQKPSQPLPRTSTPYFMQSNMKQDLQQVTNICNRIGNMKLQGNFSFNPKMNNKIIKDKGRQALESEGKGQEIERMQKNLGKGLGLVKVNNNKATESIIRKPKQNNYFIKTNNSGNKFQYDFESSSENDQAEKSAQLEKSPKSCSQKSSNQRQVNQRQNQQQGSQRQQNQRENQEQANQRDSQVMRYYQEQQRQRTDPEAMTKTRPKVTTSHNNSKKATIPHNDSKKVTTSHNNTNVGRILNHYQNPQFQNVHRPNHPQRKSSKLSHKIQNQQSFSNQQQQLITQYKKDDFGTHIPTYMRGKNQQLTENRQYQNIGQPQQGVIATNGGVCFSVDVKQFSHNGSSVVDSRPVKRGNIKQNKKKTDDRQEILKRREMAKVYSKQARFRLFGFA